MLIHAVGDQNFQLDCDVDLEGVECAFFFGENLGLELSEVLAGLDELTGTHEAQADEEVGVFCFFCSGANVLAEEEGSVYKWDLI